jgi:hypothetical protein
MPAYALDDRAIPDAQSLVGAHVDAQVEYQVDGQIKFAPCAFGVARSETRFAFQDVRLSKL